ncbi:MAG TPA: beta-N-acetylhexosaminidase [Vicinamibacterales bacterium]|nr:beta-N-acetylhexosaminidase [Vicinamibacterales bacterium]
MNRLTIALFAALVMTGACAHGPRAKAPQARPDLRLAPALQTLVPAPETIESAPGPGFTIDANTVVLATPSQPEVLRIAGLVAELCRRSTGTAPPVRAPADVIAPGSIQLRLVPDEPSLGSEGYRLAIAHDAVTVTAASPAGLFYGVQTIRQLLPYWSEYQAVMFTQPRTATLPAVIIRDRPRYPWRGAMLDVARHFFPVREVKRFIDLLALHKMNRLHLHLADDQGWRIEILKRPELTVKGAVSEVGGGPGGFYTQRDYADIVQYAADRFITIVPEIDMPGHTNAALESYAELNCDGQARPVFSGTDVGFSALCVEKDDTYRFIDDVVGEISAMTPGAYFHAGGDEVKTLTPEQYRSFIERVQTIVQAHGKQMIGWDEVAATPLLPTSIVQHWRPNAARGELARAPHLILSPGNRAYLDMKYDGDTALGLNWAGLIPVQTAYDWDPATLLPEAPGASILGVEAPLWSETTATIRDVEFLVMPRLAAIAEVGWSVPAQHAWTSFRVRLGAQGPRWTALGINFYRAPEIPWTSLK